MTLEETKQLADSGNVSAMVTLAEHYLEEHRSKNPDNDELFDLGWEYYRRAAEAGNTYAIIKMADASYLPAKAIMAMTDQLGFDIEHFEKAYKWSKKLFTVMKSDQQQGEPVDFAERRYIDTIVWLSACYNVEDKYREMKEITAGVSHPIAKALYGLALYELAELGDSIAAAFRFMECARDPSFWAEKYSSPKLLEILRLSTGSTLSFLYRNNYNDTDSAYAVFAMMIQHTKNPKLLSSLEEQISHYKRTPSGGYQYIE